MSLFKINEKDLERQSQVNDGDILGADVHIRSTNGTAHRESEKVGHLDGILVDECDRFRYLIMETGQWAAGKRVLLPIGRCTDDPERNRIYVAGLTKSHIANLPEYHDEMVVDHDYEAQLRTVYRSPAVGLSAPVESEVPVEAATTQHYVTVPQPTTPNMPAQRPAAAPANQAQPTASPKREPAPEATDDLYTMSPDQHRLRLYEERLVAEKHRQKTGEVSVSKHVETESAEASVPVQKERVVIEIESVDGATQVNTPDHDLAAGEVAQMDVYEEAATIRKEPEVRQEVNIHKEVDEDVERRQVELRRETLDIQKEGSPEVRDRTHSRSDRHPRRDG